MPSSAGSRSLLMRLMRRGDRKRTANSLAAACAGVGPWLREHRVGRANLAAAFPEKSPQEIEAILAASGTISAASPRSSLHLDRITILDPDEAGRCRHHLRSGRGRPHASDPPSRRPRLVFAAHLANWELPARFAHYYGLDTRCSIARPTSAPSPTRSSNCAPAAWARWCHPHSTRRSGWRGRSSAAATSACWSTSMTCAAST